MAKHEELRVRSGRFSIEGAASEQTVTIIKGASGRLYRFLNSGETEFKILPRGATEITLKKRASIDLNVGADVRIKVPISGTTPPEVTEGIYDLLDDQVGMRSGRFNYKPDNADSALQIVDLTGSSKPGLYRVFNSGKSDIKLVDSEGANPVVYYTPLKVDQSVDIEIDPDKSLFVKPTTGTARITGIYEFLVRKA
jgi:hypothetical protein